MPVVLAPAGAALSLALAFVVLAGAVGILRTRHDPNRCAGVMIIVLVLTLTMAASVVVFRPLRAGDLIDARPEP
jgi:hypothetical protein